MAKPILLRSALFDWDHDGPFDELTYRMDPELAPHLGTPPEIVLTGVLGQRPREAVAELVDDTGDLVWKKTDSGPFEMNASGEWPVAIGLLLLPKRLGAHMARLLIDGELVAEHQVQVVRPVPGTAH